MKKILVTGGLGFIGSITCKQLLLNGYDVVIVDNLVNSSKDVKDILEKLTGKPVTFYETDIRDEEEMDKIFKKEKPSSVIHFAGLKAVGESVAKPLLYYDNNLNGSIVLLKMMERYNVNELIFSSSATVYGVPDKLPLTEESPVKEATNPYGETKVMIEKIIRDYALIHEDFKAMLLRYFNPIGADDSYLLGEKPVGIPNNLLPYISQVATGKRPFLKVFGNDYPTEDGTCIRDYIHVVDLALGHLAALKKFDDVKGVNIYNLGTGKGTSVLELVKAYEEANHLKIPYEIYPRRAGDVVSNYASCDKALKELHWKAERSILDACRSSFEFEKRLKDYE